MTRDQLFRRMNRLTEWPKGILLLTHTDLDGAGAAVILKTIFPTIRIKTVHCDNGSMSQSILDSLRNYSQLSESSMIIATDISLNESDAVEADCLAGDHFLLFDHHPTAEYLNKYSWACIYGGKIDDSPRATKFDIRDDWHTSATALLYEYLAYCNNNWVNTIPEFYTFVHMVSAYDTWDWKTTKCDPTGIERLNSLCYIYGLEDFEREFSCRLSRNLPLFNNTDSLVLDIDKRKAKDYVAKVTKSVIEGKILIEGKAYSYAACISTDYNMQVFQHLRSACPEKDILIINTGDSISMRTDKNDIDLGKIAKMYGGGGHPAAAGIPISSEQKAQMINLPLRSELYTRFTGYFD